MNTSPKFRCERFGEVRLFETYEEALRFVLRMGDRNQLWGLEKL